MVHGKVAADDHEGHRMELEQVCGEKVYGKVAADDQKGHNAEQEKKTCGENVLVESGELHREPEGACSERDHTSNEMEGGAQ
ncbi:MAG: hypothetical protein WAP12_07335, partial [Saccharofermentanales bacterium]